VTRARWLSHRVLDALGWAVVVGLYALRPERRESLVGAVYALSDDAPRRVRRAAGAAAGAAVTAAGGACYAAASVTTQVARVVAWHRDRRGARCGRCSSRA
jgi:hypothetical protein